MIFHQFREEHFQAVNSNACFNSKKNLQKTFFDKIKIENRKWPFVIKKTASKECFFLIYVDMGIRLSKPYLTEKTFYKIMKNSLTVIFLILSTVIILDRMFEYFYKLLAA